MKVISGPNIKLLMISWQLLKLASPPESKARQEKSLENQMHISVDIWNLNLDNISYENNISGILSLLLGDLAL